MGSQVETVEVEGLVMKSMERPIAVGPIRSRASWARLVAGGSPMFVVLKGSQKEDRSILGGSHRKTSSHLKTIPGFIILMPDLSRTRAAPPLV